ncbi:MAG: PQQ-binding-like beta-propeller repeat protein [Planctomycetota bacterium]|nr:PQQ-binding-like beta-propeller repeat protein [Planctomycetota bacterium]
MIDQICKSFVVFFSVVIVGGVGTSAQDPTLDPAKNWTRFRGNDGTGVVANDPRLPESWDTKKNVKWSVEVPGWGWSSPVVWGKRVFVTSVINTETVETPKAGLYLGRGRPEPPAGDHLWNVSCFHLETGKPVWKKTVHRGRPTFPRHPKSTYASETPVVDSERLYVLFGDLGLFCFDHDGNRLWEKKILARETQWGYGAAASPVIHRNQIFMVYDNQESSYIASYDTQTGTEKWRTERQEKSTWATPFVWKHKLRTEIVVCGKRRNRSYDLNGKVLWEFNGQMSNLVIPSPFVVDNLLYVTSGYFQDRNKPVFAIHPGGTGDISLKEGETSNRFIKWFLPRSGPYNTSPIVYRGLYWTLLDRGFLTLHDAGSGEEVYGRIRFKRSMTFTSSPWAYNGKVFFLDEKGRTIVIVAGKEYQEIRVNDLEELCCATPSIADGNLLIRTASKVYCITNQE